MFGAVSAEKAEMAGKQRCFRFVELLIKRPEETAGVAGAVAAYLTTTNQSTANADPVVSSVKVVEAAKVDKALTQTSWRMGETAAGAFPGSVVSLNSENCR